MRYRHLEPDPCYSCTRVNVAYAEQLTAGDAPAHALLEWPTRANDAAASGVEWNPPFAPTEKGFCNRVRLAVGDTLSDPTFGILGSDRRDINIAGCPLYEPAVASGIKPLWGFTGLVGLTPSDVPDDHGELKSIILMGLLDGKSMVYLVLCSTESLVRTRKRMSLLCQWLSCIAVVPVNLLPKRKTVFGGEKEILLGPEQSLRMDLGDVAPHLRPQSFLQTNTRTAVGPHRQAREWVGLLCDAEDGGPHDLEVKRTESVNSEAKGAKAKGTKPTSLVSAGGWSIELWDLYRRIDGFILHCAGPGRCVTGVELSAQTIESTRASAAAAGIDAGLIVGDSLSAVRKLGIADAVTVNSPRRETGSLTSWIDASWIRFVLYSSCNPVSLAADIASMSSSRPAHIQAFDILPHTDHTKILVPLTRMPRPEPWRLPRHSRRSP